MKQKLKEAQLAEKRERREQKQQQREDKAMSRKQEKENRQMLKEQQKKDAQKQKEQARENFRQIREQEAEERNLRNQLVQNVEKEERPVRPPKKELSRKGEKSEKVQEVPDLLPMSWTASYIPLKQVKNGIIQTSDNRFVKIVEVLPINFLLRSSSEQRSIILSFMSYLKIAPPNIQLKVLSRKADIQEYIDKIDEEAEKETDERCKILQEDYAELIKSLGMKEAITRRFFLIFEYPSRSGSKNPDERDVHLYMRSAVQTAKKYLGNALKVTHKNCKGMEDFTENIESIFDYYREVLKGVMRLCDIWIEHPANAMAGIMKQAGFGKKLLAETVEQFKATTGDEPCSAYEIYCGICESITIARQEKTNERGLLALEEKIAGCVSKRWHEYDIPGTVKY